MNALTSCVAVLGCVYSVVCTHSTRVHSTQTYRSCWMYFTFLPVSVVVMTRINKTLGKKERCTRKWDALWILTEVNVCMSLCARAWNTHGISRSVFNPRQFIIAALMPWQPLPTTAAASAAATSVKYIFFVSQEIEKNRFSTEVIFWSLIRNVI